MSLSREAGLSGDELCPEGPEAPGSATNGGEVVKNLLILCLALLAWGGLVSAAVGADDPAKTSQPHQSNFFGGGEKERSPFEAVRWRGSVPEVKVKGQWYESLALNGLSSNDNGEIRLEGRQEGLEKAFRGGSRRVAQQHGLRAWRKSEAESSVTGFRQGEGAEGHTHDQGEPPSGPAST